METNTKTNKNNLKTTQLKFKKSKTFQIKGKIKM